MAPIDINNQEISSITLNGNTDIDTVEVNGQEVFSSSTGFFQGFESGTAEGWVVAFGGGEDFFGASSAEAHTGNFSLRAFDNDNPGSGHERPLDNPIVPSELEFWGYTDNHGTDDIRFGFEDASGTSLFRINFYREISGNDIFVNGSDTNYFMQTGQWHRFRAFNINPGNSFDWEIYNNNGSNLVRSGSASTSVTQIDKITYNSSGTYSGSYEYFMDDISIIPQQI